MTYDILILGTGPAALSAAIAARSRNKQVLVVGGRFQDSPLARAERIDNYPGLPGKTGLELLQAMDAHAREMGAEFAYGRVNAAMVWKGGVSLSAGSQVFQGRALILAPGVVHGQKLPGEAELLGRGVSYCATCDGMLYRGRRVMVTGNAAQAPEEANFLHQIGCLVTFVGTKRPEGLEDDVDFLSASRLEIVGGEHTAALRADGTDHPCDGVFILRPAVAPADLLPGLAAEDGFVTVDRRMATNLEGVFAAGDCTGRPWQISKAVGEGLIAALSAAEYLDAAGPA